MWAAVFFIWILLHLKTTQSATDCGVQLTSEGRIVGGEDMQRYKYPWYALLHPPRDVTTPLCSGVLIDSSHVLTAAHCYSAYEGDNNYKEKFGVTLGMYDRCINESTRVTFSVNKVVIHQNFVPPVNDYDIAIITLNQTANFTPICLPGKAERNLTDRIGEIMGFGETAEDNITMPCVLQDAYIQIFPDRRCDRSTEPNPKIICAGVIGGGVDSCQGDSGGPLQVVDTGAFVLAGIVSYGFGCGKSGYPGVYTDVYYFLDWIEANI